MDYLSAELTDREKFIIKYKAALRVGLSREQFANYMGLKPHSVMRKRLKIRDATGLNLDPLHAKEFELGEEAYVMSESETQAFEDAIEALEDNRAIERLDSYEVNKRYIITSAQNATPVEENFLKALINFSKVRDAELLVIPLRYRNPTSIWTDRNKADEWWHPTLEPYIKSYSRKLSKSLEYMGHIKIQPTAVCPLTGFESYTGSSSAIFGHPKIELKSVPTPSKSLPKLLMTTGSVTMRNFTDSKAGHKGAFHHSFAAVIVEVDSNGHHHMRHVHWDEEKNRFYDLDSYYTPTLHVTGVRIKGLITGDTHAEFMDESVEEATYTGKDSLCNRLNPEYLVLHDVEDFYRRSHHHNGNDVLAYAKHRFGRNNVEEGLQITADFIDSRYDPDRTTVVVKSNHDEAFDRWLRECDPKKDPENAKFYYYMKYHQLKSVKPTPTGFNSFDPFAWWCFNPDEQSGLKNPENVIFLERDESFELEEIELGFHGDDGPNGSRGSVLAFSKIGPKVVLGHSHSPAIREGAYQVGVSARLDLEYASGPSSWMHTHCIVYPNGTRTLIHIIDGKYCGDF